MTRWRDHPNLARFLLLAGVLLALAITQQNRLQEAYRQSRQGHDDGLPAQTAQELAELAAAYPWQIGRWAQAGAAALQADQPALAVEYFRQAALQQPLDRQHLALLGEAYARLDETDQALAAYQSALAMPGAQPSDHALQGQLASLYRQQGSPQETAAAVRALLVFEPENAALHAELGLLLLASDLDAAVQSMERAAELDTAYLPTAEALRRSLNETEAAGEPAYTLVTAGQALAGLGLWQQAEQLFERAAALRPDYAEAWAFLGQAQLASGQSGLAALEQALALDPDSLAGNSLIGLYWISQGNSQRALPYLQKAIQIEPSNASLRIDLARALALNGDLGGAQEQLIQAEEAAQSEPAIFRLAALLSLEYNLNLQEAALPAARRAVILTGGDAASLDVLAQVYIRLGDLASARRLLEEALQKQPDFAAAHLHLGGIYLLEDDQVQALDHLHTVQNLAPGSREADQAARLLSDK